MADKSVADQLRELGVKNANVLVRMAERGQLLALRCEMPQCYHHKGRGAFDPVTTARTKWAPSRDHYPILKSAGGKLVPQNVRLSHTECNQRDYNRRKQIGTLLENGKSLAVVIGSPGHHDTSVSENKAILCLCMTSLTCGGSRRLPTSSMATSARARPASMESAVSF